MGAIHKGETLHALRRDLHLAHQGVIRRSHLEQQSDQTLFLSLVTNAVVTWNTAYLQLALDAEEGGVDEALLAHLSPALLEHVNPYGI